jgi:hypothetical protein
VVDFCSHQTTKTRRHEGLTKKRTNGFRIAIDRD